MAALWVVAPCGLVLSLPTFQSFTASIMRAIIAQKTVIRGLINKQFEDLCRHGTGRRLHLRPRCPGYRTEGCEVTDRVRIRWSKGTNLRLLSRPGSWKSESRVFVVRADARRPHVVCGPAYRKGMRRGYGRCNTPNRHPTNKSRSVPRPTVLLWEMMHMTNCGARARRFITAFTTARHRSQSWARWIHSTPPQPICLRAILIPSSHLRLGLPSGLFASGFPTKKTVYTFFFSHSFHMPRPSHSSWFDLPNDIRESVSRGHDRPVCAEFYRINKNLLVQEAD
jgi:hypothetical protein